MPALVEKIEAVFIEEEFDYPNMSILMSLLPVAARQSSISITTNTI